MRESTRVRGPRGSRFCCLGMTAALWEEGLVTRTTASRLVIALLAASLVLADLGMGLWHTPSAAAQSAAPYHWARKRSHFRLRVGNNVKGDWNRYLRGALEEWNQGETVTLIEVDGATNPQYCDPVSGTVQVCDWWYGTQTGWLGLARLYFNARGDHIDAATVQLNNSFMYAPTVPTTRMPRGATPFVTSSAMPWDWTTSRPRRASTIASTPSSTT
jgi:hypothetical protein